MIDDEEVRRAKIAVELARLIGKYFRVLQVNFLRWRESAGGSPAVSPIFIKAAFYNGCWVKYGASVERRDAHLRLERRCVAASHSILHASSNVSRGLRGYTVALSP